MTIDVEAVRAATPGCAETIHVNNAGSSLPPAIVLDTVVEYLQTEARIGGYEIVDERGDQLAAVYTSACNLFGGEPDNWAFVESATRAWNAAFSALRFEPGDRVLTTKAEYPSNMAGILRAHEIQGVEVDIVPDDEHGQLDIAALESMLDDRTRLVSVTHIPTQGGLINPAEAVGELLNGTDVLYQIDACQSAGQLPVNVDELGCDILSFTGRKFLRGPRGTGMVWTSDRALSQMDNPAGVDMQGANWDTPMKITPLPHAGRFEPYEIFFAGKVGLAAALDYAASIGMEDVEARNLDLAAQLRNGLSAIPGVQVHDKGARRSALVTFTADGHEAGAIKTALRAKSINVSVSTATSARLDFPERGLSDVVRASVHYFNTTEEIDQVLEAVAALG